ncbi:MAG TPA: HEAT repeat domain-containing protein [Dongiaceae bacterium]|nr:HEAT repeat domain-containing protein [Dongiaceae bacterium]
MRMDAARIEKLMGVTFVVSGLLGLVLQMRGEGQFANAAGVPQAAQNARTGCDIPQFQNAHVEKREVRGALADEVRRWASEATTGRWLGYSAAEVEGDRTICCGDWNDGRCGTCRLENGKHGFSINDGERADKATVHLEGSRQIAILFRVEHEKIGKIRSFSAGCVVDAGGRDVLWLENVKASDSVALLEGYVTAEKTDRENESLGKSALSALAMHQDASAESALESFVESSRPEWLRRETAFWLGEARGADGFHALQRMARSDPSTNVREQVTFALSVSKEPDAVNEMIRMAHDDRSAHVRGQALFWLGQKAGKKAVSAIDGAIQDDPDTEVKKKAVFALSQLPKDEGVPKLIEVAQTNRNPEVRKQAMFWLGQSEDPRALAFFEKVLAQ